MIFGHMLKHVGPQVTDVTIREQKDYLTDSTIEKVGIHYLINSHFCNHGQSVQFDGLRVKVEMPVLVEYTLRKVRSTIASYASNY